VLAEIRREIRSVKNLRIEFSHPTLLTKSVLSAIGGAQSAASAPEPLREELATTLETIKVGTRTLTFFTVGSPTLQ